MGRPKHKRHRPSLEQRHRPNLGQWEIQGHADNYARHQSCGGLIASVPGKQIPRCIRCKQKAGKLAKEKILRRMQPMQERIPGMGMQDLYYTAPEGEEEVDEGERQVRQMEGRVGAMFPGAPASGPSSSPPLSTYGSIRRKRRRKLLRLKTSRHSTFGKSIVTSGTQVGGFHDQDGRKLSKPEREHFLNQRRAEAAHRDHVELDYVSPDPPLVKRIIESSASYVARAKEKIAQCLGDGEAVPNWATQTIKDHLKAQREQEVRDLSIAKIAIKDYEEKIKLIMRLPGQHPGNAAAIAYFERQKRFYEES